MSPELLALDHSRLKNNRPTKQSDCYAFGMVIYEVLSGRAPFSPFNHYIVIRKVVDGERPERPKGVEGVWFTDDLWRMLSQSWAPQPESRPSVAAVLECLERVSRGPDSPSLQLDGMDGDGSDPASASSNPRCFSTFLRRILC